MPSEVDRHRGHNVGSAVGLARDITRLAGSSVAARAARAAAREAAKRLSEGSSSGRSKKQKTILPKGSAVASTSDYKAEVRKRKAKGIDIKKKKKKKISKKLKAAILDTLAAKEPMGKYTLKLNGGGFAKSAFITNQQSAFNGGQYGSFDCPWDFIADHFINAASILFNGAPYTAGTFEFNQPDFPLRFATHTMKLRVLNSSVRYSLWNKTIRTMYIKVYEIAPRAPGSFYHTNQANKITDTGTVYATVANDEAQRDLVTEWTNAATTDFNNRARFNSLVGTVAVTQLGNAPNMSPSFRGKYKVSKTEDIKLEPNERHDVFVQGPNDKVLSYERYTHDGTYYNVRPEYTRGTLFVVSLDVVPMEAGGVHTGFARANGSTSAGGLSIEKTLRFKLECPEETVELNRKDCEVTDIVHRTFGAGTGVEQSDDTNQPT